jgi:hypothetical protein
VKADHFDSLTRELAGGISRRQALRLLGGAVLGAALSRACVLSGDDGGVAPICFPPFPVGPPPVTAVGMYAAGGGSAVKCKRPADNVSATGAAEASAVERNCAAATGSVTPI